MSRLQWYLIYTKPRAESTAEANLRNQGYEVCSPKISFAEKEETRTEPMFSRYIFTRFDIKQDNWSSIKSTIGVSHIVSFGSKLAIVPTELVNYIKKISDKNCIYKQINLSSEYHEGDKVTVTRGILKGNEGVFLSTSSKKRVKVLLKILNRTISSDMPISNLAKKTTKKQFKL